MIETTNLKLLACEARHFEAILTDQQQLKQLLSATVFDNWFDFPGVSGIEAIQFSHDYLKAHPDALGWWTYLFVHRDNVLVGLGGFRGRPDESGTVEIGYAIVPAYRRRGLATEAARGLVDYAFSHEPVDQVDAHTLAEPNASTKVLKKVGLSCLGTVNDPDDGEIWHWRLKREDYRKA